MKLAQANSHIGPGVGRRPSKAQEQCGKVAAVGELDDRPPEQFGRRPAKDHTGIGADVSDAPVVVESELSAVELRTGVGWPTSSAIPTARSENARRSSPSVSLSARSPWPEPSTTPNCHNRY
jgi:hypothetical protein